MSKLGCVKIVDIPKFKVVSSGLTPNEEMFAEGKNNYLDWLHKSENKRLFKKDVRYNDYWWHDDNKSCLIIAVDGWVTEADTVPYDIIEFPGGIFVVGVADENDEKDRGEVESEILKWVENSGVLEIDSDYSKRIEDVNIREKHFGKSRFLGMGHSICCSAESVLGIAQQEIFFPVKLRTE